MYEKMEYLKFDITAPLEEVGADGELDKEAYDVIIDKACLDCVACHEDSAQMEAAIRNIHALLVPGGVLVLVSRGAPETRSHLFEPPDFEVEASEVNDDSEDDFEEFKTLSNIDTQRWAEVRCLPARNQAAAGAWSAVQQLQQADVQNQKLFVYVAQKNQN